MQSEKSGLVRLVRGVDKSKGFVRAEQFAAAVQKVRARAAQPAAFQRWQAFSSELRKRDDLVAYYDFQPDDDDRAMLRNRALTGRKFDGRVQNADWTQGPFPGKYALQFRGVQSGVRVNIPEPLKRLTLAAWVRIDSLPNKFSGLLMSDSQAAMGKLQWLVCQNGNISLIGFFVNPQHVAGGATSGAVMRGDNIAQWRLLSVTCDLSGEAAAFYVDGNPVGQGSLGGQVTSRAVSLGQATIGGWFDSVRPNVTDLALRGRIGELILFREALSPEEIRQLFQSTTF